MIHFILSLSLLISADNVEKTESFFSRFFQVGGQEKALKHLDCFLKNHAKRTFKLQKKSKIGARCNRVQGHRPKISLGRKKIFAVIDYTLPSNQKRLFIYKKVKKQLELQSSHFVAHGFYDPWNIGFGFNSVTWMRFSSNKDGSLGSPSGLFIAGKRYMGQFNGPKDNKYSLVVHGIEKEVNENSCERAIVLHGSKYVLDNTDDQGNEAGVFRMSNGCFMVGYDIVNEVIKQIKGSPRHGGALIFVYGPRESKLPEDYYCSKSAKDLFL